MAPAKTSNAIAVLFAGIFSCALAAFAPAADAATESVVYSFQNNDKDGLFPQAQLTNVNGTLFGTTANGGTGGCSGGCGTIFTVNPTTDAESVLYSFRGDDRAAPQPGTLLATRNALFGTTSIGGHRDAGMVFSFDPQSGAFRQRYYFCSLYGCLDGSTPTSGLLVSKSTLYGTTCCGGPDSGGVVFSFDPKNNSENVLYAFCSLANCADGDVPRGALLNVKGILYGTTISGGNSASCCGTVFSLDPNSGAESVIYNFCSHLPCVDGSQPLGELVILKHRLYGTTYEGGLDNLGTIFAIDLSNGHESVLHSFSGGSDGSLPGTGLIDLNGILYGTTEYGNANANCPSQCGVVYSIDPNTGAETIVYSFCSQPGCVDGAVPTSSLLNVNGTLYGVTQYGGSGSCVTEDEPNGCGTVYAITP
ncbi:MAG TPA: choice-of-anchor tandem repeat GloVer-containing protein [Rhizomicrobium sp.]|nr:choice-of-anchor tandem repeat GloVer-containing protein [Rhizomicrobium sp.]